MLETLLVIATGAVGLFGVIKGSISSYSQRMAPKIKIEVGDKIIVLDSDVSKESLTKIILSLQESSVVEKSEPGKTKQEGFVTVEIMLLVVPGIIALLFAATFAYLLVVNQANPDYQTPNALEMAMTTILGYYFGIGASTVAVKGKTLSTEEVKALLSK